MDAYESILSMLLADAVNILDIPPDLQTLAIERYEEVGTWLADNGGDRWRIYPQGSFRLGTVVRPATATGEYDIDLVCLHHILKESTTQEALKNKVGDMLREYLRWKKSQGEGDGPTGCEPRRRCWALPYPGFHLDVLPTIPDVEHPPTGILLTDKRLREWQHSNPIGYAAWFRTRSEELRRGLIAAAEARHVNVDEVPEFLVRSTLQRVVQVLKWHCMHRFENDLDNRPPSILITTLAGHAYDGEPDLFTATLGVVTRMPDFIEGRNGAWWVANPAHEEENFTDKWNEYPQRRIKFHAWLREITVLLNDLAKMQGKGLHVVASRMSESFPADPVRRAAERYGIRLREQRDTRGLRMTATGTLSPAATAGPRVPGHNFYGR